jgi:hypothetical protein
VAWRELFRYPRNMLLSSSLQLFYLAGSQGLVLWSTGLLVLVLTVTPAEAWYMMIFVTAVGFAGRFLGPIYRMRSGGVHRALWPASARAGNRCRAHFRGSFIGPVPVFCLLLMAQRLIATAAKRSYSPIRPRCGR